LKLLQEIIGDILQDTGIDSDFLNRTLIAMGSDKSKCFCTAKETITRVKRRPTEQEQSLPAIYPRGDQYSEYIKNSKNQTLKEQIIQSINE
jgi:hypothetical protein